ncbi:MAG TPA: hypothetical protein VKD71_10980 [Gemmataceae bacterium]|nr:hypothetical protein [Gemmataceae bacterium]
MSRPSLAVALLIACGCAASGCAALAKKPPTPADDISPRQSAAITAAPGERYFVLVFGSQTCLKHPKYTHTWATVVKVTGCNGPAAPTVEPQTISWLPATLDIRVWSLCVEPGVNLALNSTVEEMLRNDERVSLWGPYEVRPGFAYRFSVQKAFMESGQVGYQCIDTIGEAAHGTGCDCIHAITDMDPLFDRSRYPLSYFGDAASQNIVRQLQTRPIIICPEADHSWLLPLLGLDKYPIERRTYSGPSLPWTPENAEQYLNRVTPN